MTDRHLSENGRDIGGQLIGAVVSAGFGAAWAVGCASVLMQVSRPAGFAVGAVGVLFGVGLIVAAWRLRSLRRAPGAAGRPNAMFASLGYRVIVAIEVVAIVAAGPVLGRLGLGRYTVIWIAYVVGLHFLGFGKLFWRGFYVIGAVLTLAASIAVVLAVALVSAVPATALVTGVAAADLLAAATIALVSARAHR